VRCAPARSNAPWWSRGAVRSRRGRARQRVRRRRHPDVGWRAGSGELARAHVRCRPRAPPAAIPRHSRSRPQSRVPASRAHAPVRGVGVERLRARSARRRTMARWRSTRWTKSLAAGRGVAARTAHGSRGGPTAGSMGAERAWSHRASALPEPSGPLPRRVAREASRALSSHHRPGEESATTRRHVTNGLKMCPRPARDPGPRVGSGALGSADCSAAR